MSCKGQVQKIEAWFKTQGIFSEDQRKELAQENKNSPVGAPQASSSKNLHQKVTKKGKKAPKNNQKRKKKAKEKGNPNPQNSRFTKEKTAMENVFNMERSLMEFKNKEEERMNQSLPKKQTS
ncbi:hypothetical protein O181_007072 [Austropuccinia psidii MF-1]|uniref:Uncharacterized protein n=1 Tax=Austropuccinia psidii MF-1 TaxID=1389203 RepID=A0A9Q3BM09_9BASI|nr:hypothetical protein [Austropuccinia psidii MF-1]